MKCCAPVASATPPLDCLLLYDPDTAVDGAYSEHWRQRRFCICSCPCCEIVGVWRLSRLKLMSQPDMQIFWLKCPCCWGAQSDEGLASYAAVLCQKESHQACTGACQRQLPAHAQERTTASGRTLGSRRLRSSRGQSMEGLLHLDCCHALTLRQR